MEQECSSLQRELHETREALASQRDEHEAAQSAATESIAAALKGAQEMQAALESREARVAELQVSVALKRPAARWDGLCVGQMRLGSVARTAMQAGAHMLLEEEVLGVCFC